ncbi:AEC family transporter [Thiomicrorhabdus xiamenensis]|uniref:AEC family transporter n=1 Tax=Thiomicrorhabdus xiamenensis TaxID=2739063 RepID=A0A7D4NKM2_9GAMM|nr:AEC family transporter [Thiomicrorhabdus xiamenensis]QKI89329.1 AEC family transporter [Thiomicrorhabdus xiamenensis]
MLQTLSILLPVFALIAAGFASRKLNLLGPNSASELSRFVIWLALPALLFDIMAHTSWQTLWHVEFIVAYLVGTLGVFFVVILWRRWQGAPLTCASIDGVAGAYSNTGYVGFPLLFLIFGASSQVPTIIATIIVVCILFALALVLIESDLKADTILPVRIVHALIAVLKNPLVFAPIMGFLFSLTGWRLPQGAETFLDLLGAAASPAALISLGLFLADAMQRSTHSSQMMRRIALQLTFLKLIVQPLIVAWLVLGVFKMDTEWAYMAILLAALPTGTGPYMLAEFYKRDALITAQTILFTTVLSLFSLTLILLLMGYQPPGLA